MNQRADHNYEFGPFRLDTAKRLLLREGETVPLTPKALDLLIALVQSHKHWGCRSAGLKGQKKPGLPPGLDHKKRAGGLPGAKFLAVDAAERGESNGSPLLMAT